MVNPPATPASDDPPGAGRLAQRWDLFWLVSFGAVMTAVIVQESLTRGRLSLPPGYDDVTYLLDGAHRLEDLYRGGVPALVSGYLANPPHAPYSSALAMAAFAIFGVHDWAPYAANGLLLLFILGAAAYCCRDLPRCGRAACVVAMTLLPFSVMAVFQFRPDLASGVLGALGILLLLGRPESPWAPRAAIAGACFGGAMLAKPSSFPATLIAFTAAVGLRCLLDWRGQAGWIQRIRATRWPLLAVGTLVAVAGPHFVVGGRKIWVYIEFNMFGRGRAFWTQDRPISEHLMYYLSGEGGRVLLGPHAAWVLLALAVASAALAAGDARRRGAELCLLVMLVLLWAISTAAPVKNPFFGAPFFALLIFCAARGLAALGRAAGRRSGVVWRGGACALPAAAAAASLLAFRWPGWIAPDHPMAIAMREVPAELNEALRRAGGQEPARVLLTFTGSINGSTLEWLALREGRAIETRSAQAARSINSYNHLLFEWGAGFAIACDPGTGLTATNFPSAAMEADMVRYFESNPEWERVADVPSRMTGSAFHVYRRRPVAAPAAPAAPSRP